MATPLVHKGVLSLRLVALDGMRVRAAASAPSTVLADANHANHEAIAAAIARGVETLVPVPSRTRASGPNGNHEPAILEWKARVEGAHGHRGSQALYRVRAGLSEWTNAQFAGRFPLRQFLVRGLDEATASSLAETSQTELRSCLPAFVSGISGKTPPRSRARGVLATRFLDGL